MGLTLTMRGRIGVCVLLSLRVRASAMAGLVAPPLRLVTLERAGERWAFFNVVLCHIEGMRPVGAPRWPGWSYHHFAYRLMVSCRGADGREVRGLCFLRSEVDSWPVAVLGNLVSDFRMHRSGPRIVDDANALVATCNARDGAHPASLRVTIDKLGRPTDPAEPGSTSIFASEGEAAGVLKYEPLGLAPSRDGKRIGLAEVIRDEDAWRERPVKVSDLDLGYLRRYTGDGLALERATMVEPIEYRWRLGRVLKSV